MGRGSSKITKIKTFPNQLYPDTDNDSVENWGKFANSFGDEPTDDEKKSLSGYIATGNAFRINKSLYSGKEDQMPQKDKDTVDVLDRMIATHSTPNDGYVARFAEAEEIQSALGLSDNQLRLLNSAVRMDSSELKLLNQSLTGSSMASKSFTSSSAISSHIFFSDRQYRREISLPKGTPAFAADNHNEHEVVLGRNLHTVLDSVSVDPGGKWGPQIVLHEHFEYYGKED